MGPKQIFCAPDRNSIIDEFFSVESQQNNGGDDEQLPLLSPIFYQ